MVTELFEILQYGFIQNAIVAGTAASIICGLVGVFIILKRITFISGGIAHTSFGGIGLGYLLNVNPIITAVFFSILSALGIGIISKRSHLHEDTIIGVVWAMGMSLGVIFIGMSPGYAPDLMSYLFGNILAVTSWDLQMMIFLASIIFITIIAFYKELVVISFDEEYARAIGIPAEALYLLLLCLVALTIVLLIKVVGIIMVIALLTIPAATGSQFSKDLKKIIALSIAFGIFFVISGLFVSYHLDIASGATIVLIAGGTFLLSVGVSEKKRSVEIER
ncbi:MAG: metal ABC transporter permease [Halobacteriota archaeon]|nr:metal ABC transporter permease [Halobacteriota archaeon]